MRRTNRISFYFTVIFSANLCLGLNANAEIIVAADKVKVPFIFANGLKLYNQNCSGCHGRSLEGTKQGPPLLHPFYKASHHGDSAFYKAALKGVRAHHWKFGDMPPIKGMTVKKMESIIPYIRWYQKENGL